MGWQWSVWVVRFQLNSHPGRPLRPDVVQGQAGLEQPAGVSLEVSIVPNLRRLSYPMLWADKEHDLRASRVELDEIECGGNNIMMHIVIVPTARGPGQLFPLQLCSRGIRYGRR